MTVPALAPSPLPTRVPSPGRPGRSSPMPRATVAAPWDRVRFAATATTDDGDDAAADLPVPDDVVPADDPAAWSGSLVRAAVEALTGSRPVAQLARWLTADIYDSLARRAGLAVRIKGRPTLVRQAVVRRVHLCPISPLAAEASVVVHDGERVRAAAVRIEAHRGRWRATALEIG